MITIRWREHALQTAGVHPKHQQDVQEHLRARVGYPQPGDMGAIIVHDRVTGRMQDIGSGDGVVAESLDGQQPSVGGVADLPQQLLPEELSEATRWIIEQLQRVWPFHSAHIRRAGISSDYRRPLEIVERVPMAWR